MIFGILTAIFGAAIGLLGMSINYGDDDNWFYFMFFSIIFGFNISSIVHFTILGFIK